MIKFWRFNKLRFDNSESRLETHLAGLSYSLIIYLTYSVVIIVFWLTVGQPVTLVSTLVIVFSNIFSILLQQGVLALLIRTRLPEIILGFAIVLSIFLHALVDVSFSRILTAPETNRQFLVDIFLSFVWVMWTHIAWYLAILYHLSRKQAEKAFRKSLEMEKAFAQDRLKFLQNQINPHFLFNSLNAVSSLISLGRPEESQKVVYSLGALLRRGLSSNSDPFSTLADEVESARTYLEIEGFRFPERLKIEWTIDGGLDFASIPKFTLQTLIENVIKHGVSRTSELITATIEIRKLDHSRIKIAVKNDRYTHLEKDTDKSNTTGVGLKNLQQRMEILFPNCNEFFTGPVLGTTYESRIVFPLEYRKETNENPDR